LLNSDPEANKAVVTHWCAVLLGFRFQFCILFMPQNGGKWTYDYCPILLAA